MKRQIIGICIAAVLLAGCATSQECAEERARREQAVTASVESRHYDIDIRMMYPQRGRSVNVGSNYSLSVHGDTLISYLPYFGRAYNVPYGGGKGLNFQSAITSYQVATPKDGEWHVEIATRNEEDEYRYSLDLFSNGSATIRVLARERDPISYSGEVLY